VRRVGVTFFESPQTGRVDGEEVEWFTPTEHCRGPWDPDACHAGPPTGLLVRALERIVPGVRLARITVDLTKPIPLAGFRIAAEILREGRAAAVTRATIVDESGGVRVVATGLHVATSEAPLFDAARDNSGVSTPRLADSEPGPFPIDVSRGHGLPGFSGAIQVRYPPGQGRGPGATTIWMSAAPLLPDEMPSPFQSVCPLADCGNALSRHTEGSEVGFVNADLTIALHRDPVGGWVGSRAVSWWQPNGVGLAEALLFDDDGPVGRALQTMVLRPGLGGAQELRLGGAQK
jgi:hypothetical protein